MKNTALLLRWSWRDLRAHWAKVLAIALVACSDSQVDDSAYARVGVTDFAELGPGSVLTGMAKRTVSGSRTISVATPEDLDKLLEWVGAGTSSGPTQQEGEHLFAVERLVVSPAAGIFTPIAALRDGSTIDVGTVVGHVGDDVGGDVFQDDPRGCLGGLLQRQHTFGLDGQLERVVVHLDHLAHLVHQEADRTPGRRNDHVHRLELGWPLGKLQAATQIDQREVLEEGQIDLSEGLVGDYWRDRNLELSKNGGIDTQNQVTLMNARAIALLARSCALARRRRSPGVSLPSLV